MRSEREYFHPICELGQVGHRVQSNAAGWVPVKHVGWCRSVTADGGTESTLWKIHGERLVDDTRRLRLSIASVELPDGVQFEQYVLRMPKAAMMVVLDDKQENVLMMWRHRFIIDRWVWELPGGYVDPDEDPAVTAAREVEEETGWRPRNVKPLVSLQPSVGTTDAENLLFVSYGADYIGEPEDINEAEQIDWVPLDSIRERIDTGQIIGAASLVGLLHVLAFHAG
jgi:8-oxo-dGTP pyrophosphatase MutT (NUDIX family)